MLTMSIQEKFNNQMKNIYKNQKEIAFAKILQQKFPEVYSVTINDDDTFLNDLLLHIRQN